MHNIYIYILISEVKAVTKNQIFKQWNKLFLLIHSRY